MKKIICLMAASCCAVSVMADPYDFLSASGQSASINVDAWAGSGTNQAILVVDWQFMGGPYQTESHAFGFRWDGTAYESDMLNALNDAGIFTVTSGYGGAFLENIVYNDGTETLSHADEPGSWDLASADSPYAQWGPWGTGNGLGDWHDNQAGYNEELLQNGLLEGINAILWYGTYPDGTTVDDYNLNVPLVPTPEPSAIALCAVGGLFLLCFKRNRIAKLS